MNVLLTATASIKSLIENSKELGLDVLREVLTEAGKYLNTDICLSDKNGGIIFQTTAHKSEKKADLLLKAAGLKTGTLTFYQNQEQGQASGSAAGQENSFSAEQTIFIDFITTITGLVLAQLENEKLACSANNTRAVKAVFGVLTFSELSAVLCVFRELGFGVKDGYITASKIAGKDNITRSIIANALRKLESAGIIETRSLGVKGTYIKVLNDSFYTELARFD